MKKRLLSLFLALYTVLNLFSAVTAAAGSTLLAVPSKTNFVLNGKPVSVTQAYTINGTNYLQLRAIAELLNGTAAPAALKSTKNARESTTSFKLNGAVIAFEKAYLIDGPTNYLQLREFAAMLKGTASQFNMYWDAAANRAVIVPGDEYIGEAPPAGLASIKIGQTEAQAGIAGAFRNCATPDGVWGFTAVMKNSLLCTTQIIKQRSCTQMIYPPTKTAEKFIQTQTTITCGMQLQLAGFPPVMMPPLNDSFLNSPMPSAVCTACPRSNGMTSLQLLPALTVKTWRKGNFSVILTRTVKARATE